MAERGEGPASVAEAPARRDGPLYLDHFGLREAPFSITPDTDFVFSSAGHQEALNTLLVALSSGEGFVKITGDVGTGKTLLCRRLLATLDPQRFVSAYLPNPALAPRTLLLALAEELGIPVAEALQADEYHLLKALRQALLDVARDGRSTVVCLDEAQAMPLESLETLRLVSNLETEKRKLLHLVMFGQPELDERLAEPGIRQLKQRISFHYRLAGLSRQELANYVAHRLRIAGQRDRGAAVFTRRAVTGLHRASGGVPRLANILAHKALLAAFGEGSDTVGWRHIRRAARDTEGARSLFWW